MSIWSEIHNDFTDEDGTIFIDAWTTGYDDESGSVIAKVYKGGTVEYIDVRAKGDEFAQEAINEAIRNQQNPEYAKGGKLSSFWDATKKHASSAFHKTKHVSKKAYDKTKKAVKDKIHDTKKNIALEVIDDTKDKVNDNKYKMTLKGAENLVEAKYDKGGKTQTGWDKFVNWLNEPI